MTAFCGFRITWGQFGAVWDRHTPEGKMIIPTATVFIRPQRYTKEFFYGEEYFTVCAFGAGYKKALAYLGTHVGRDDENYPKKDFHEMYVGEIIKLFRLEDA